MRYVYVLNKHGQPLMPCKPRKARKLLDTKKAHVFKRTPFTVQLNYETSNKRQHVTLDIDAGSKTIGISASTERYELFAAEMLPRNYVTGFKISSLQKKRRSRCRGVSVFTCECARVQA